MRLLVGVTLVVRMAGSDSGPRIRAMHEQIQALSGANESQRAALETCQFILETAARMLGVRLGPPEVNGGPRAKQGKKGATRRRVTGPRVDLDKDLKLAEDLVAGLVAGGDPLATRAGDMRHAYRSGVDGTLQPYRIYVPEPLVRAQQYPLVVVLHGLTSDENTYMDRYINFANNERVLPRLAQERGYIVVCPRGRAPQGRYTGTAEKDVLEVMDRAMALYPIRKDQVFLTGHSLGGVGTWRIGFGYAERFAGLAAVGSAFRGQPAMISQLPLDQKRDMPVLYCQGRRDWLAPLRMGRTLAHFVRPLLPNFVYKEFPDTHARVGTTSLPTVFDFFDAIREGRQMVAEEIPAIPPPAPPKKAPVKKPG